MCNTVAPFSRATFLSLVLRLYLAYSKLLKLTAVSNVRRTGVSQIPIDNCWSSRPSSPEINSATDRVVPIHKITQAWHDHTSVASHLSQMMLQKCSKMQHIFAYNGLPWRATALWLTLLERSDRAHVKLYLTCNSPTYRFRDIRGQMAKIGVWEAKNGHFLDPVFGDP